MKILIICHEFPPLGGGAANATFYLTKYLADKKHQITILTSRFKNQKKSIYQTKIVYLPVLRWHIDRASPFELISFALSGMLYALFFIRRLRFDACLAIHGIPSGWVALFIFKIFKIPYLVSLRGGDVPGFLPQSYDRLHRKIQFLTNFYWYNARFLITNSQGLKEISDVTANKIKKRVEIIPNGIDCQVFRPDYSLRDNQTIRIIYTGRITLQKGLGCLIEAIEKCSSQIRKAFIFEIIGSGPLKEYLKGISVGLQDARILTFTDWMNKEDLLLKYKKAHIFILPSLYEGMSNSLLEAMACGCMIIATDIAGNHELVRDGENGFIFKPNDITRLKELLVEVLNSDSVVIENMGKKSRTIAEKYDWNEVTNKYLSYIDKLYSDNEIK